jgi:hypothetical protein
MTHTRTLVREHLARELVRRGAWADAVFVDPATAIADDEHFPNICIYTQSERTTDRMGNNAWGQELSLLIEVRAKRPDDMNLPWSDNIAGMPNHPGQTGNTSRVLDDVCQDIEKIIISTFHRRNVKVEGQTLSFEAVSGINTDITRDASSEHLYVLAQIEFKLNYQHCIDPLPPESCPLEHIFGMQVVKPCNTADPLNGMASMPSGNYMPESLLSDCR